MARCEGENRYGRQCGSNALPGSKYCKDHQEQGKHKDKKKTQSISRIPKVRYILIVVLLVLLIISGYFIFSQKENAFFDCKNSAFSSSGVYISGIEARNSKLVSPVINLKINISKSLKQFSLEAKCSEFQKNLSQIRKL